PWVGSFFSGGDANTVYPLGGVKDVSPSLTILTTSVSLVQRTSSTPRSLFIASQGQGDSIPLDTPPCQLAVGSLAAKKEEESKLSTEPDTSVSGWF
ncbi:MAG: hypothetical protein QGI06_11310, partial [Rhodospirillales bacterium]|nr:hypothetical protein [Rhodospirillales bacterium]